MDVNKMELFQENIIYELKIGDSFKELNGRGVYYEIIRVPNGWLFNIVMQPAHDGSACTSQFIPFAKEKSTSKI